MAPLVQHTWFQGRGKPWLHWYNTHVLRVEVSLQDGTDVSEKEETMKQHVDFIGVESISVRYELVC